jgi:hypothetical protein
VFVVKPSVVLELTFVKRCLLFFVYGSCRKERTYVTRRSKKRRRKIEEKSRELILQKNPHLPCFIPCFYSHSAEFLQQAVSLILLSFPYLFYCPWSVSCWKIQPTHVYSPSKVEVFVEKITMPVFFCTPSPCPCCPRCIITSRCIVKHFCATYKCLV